MEKTDKYTNHCNIVIYRIKLNAEFLVRKNLSCSVVPDSLRPMDYSQSREFSSQEYWSGSVQFSLVAQSCLTLCDPMNHSTPGLLVHHQLLEFTQTHVHRVGDAIQPSHPPSSPSPLAPSPSSHQGLFQCVNSLHEVVKVLEFQHQSFQ